MKKIIGYTTGLIATFSPLFALAATNEKLSDIITKIEGYLNEILLLLMGVAIVMFVFYVVKYFFRPDADRKEAGMYVMYAVIGFFVMLSFWGIVNILQNSFNLKNTDNRPQSWQEFTNLFPSK